MALAGMVRVAGSDDTLIRALAEHRPAADGWQLEPLGTRAEDQALVILDFDDAAAQRGAIGSLRSDGFRGPILVLGGDESALGHGEEAIRRPIRLGVLLMRIAAHWAGIGEAASVMLGPYEFLPDDSLLRGDDGEAIRLTELECRLLTFLAEAEGGLVGRDQLLGGVWGYSAAIDTHTVETHIWRLRQKIETADPATRFLVTETGGYRLLCGG